MPEKNTGNQKPVMLKYKHVPLKLGDPRKSKPLKTMMRPVSDSPDK
jgi:hypothetical protein